MEIREALIVMDKELKKIWTPRNPTEMTYWWESQTGNLDPTMKSVPTPRELERLGLTLFVGASFR